MKRLALLFAAVAWVSGIGTARAEIVVLTTGRTLSVKAHRVEDGRAVLELREGGAILCDPALIARVEPDEVPWPEPRPEPQPQPAAVVAAPAAASPGFEHLIGPLARQYGVEPALVQAVVATESAFEPRARSPRGAMGLMQLMPGTAHQYDVSNPYDPSANLDAGIRHLKFLLGRYDMRVALAAYNAGEGTVRRHGGVPPYRETRNYIDRVMQRLQLYRQRGASATVAVEPARPGLASPAS